MMRHAKLLVLSGLAVGACCGAIAAVAIPQTATSPAAAPAPSVAPAAVGVRRVAAARHVPRGLGYVLLRPRGPVRLAVTVPDPRGGPPWAVRQFLAERLAPDGHGGARVIGRNRCVQLGRVHRGHFGWLTADGTFRRVGVSFAGAPTHCLSRRPDLGGRPLAEVITTITDPRRSAAEPVQTIVYGLAGPAAREPRLTVAGRPAAIHRGVAGTLLAVLAPDARAPAVRLTVGYPRRGTVALLPARGPASRLPSRFTAGVQQPVRGAAPVLAAQAPDPAGGLPFGMTATPSSEGEYCTSTGGRVVGDRVGGIDYDLDLMRENGGSGSGSCPPTRAARRSQRLPGGRTRPPFSLGMSFGGGLGTELGEDPAAGRVARRSPPGLVIYSGTADRSVRYLTFATPSDVRTIAPSGPAHAFLIVYGGIFPTGDTVVTTTFKDGGTRHDTVPNPGI